VIVGVVKGRAPRVMMMVYGTGERQEAVEFIVDTGFTPEYAAPLAAREPVIGESRGLPSG